MTRRERMERKIERRQEWAAKASAKSAARFDAVHKLADSIPFGQPILVGHHSERHARRDVERLDNGMRKGVEQAKLADHHASKASGLALQLERSVFSDDPDAIPALEARIAEAEAKAEKINALNKAWRAASKAGGKPEEIAARLVASGACAEKLAATMAKTMAQCPWLKTPLDATGERAAARRDRERMELIRKRQARAAAAEANGGVTVEFRGEYVIVTFAEKPASAMLEALRAAEFRWCDGSWSGLKAKMPEEILDYNARSAAERVGG
jgi:uncharacterized protein DUF3560